MALDITKLKGYMSSGEFGKDSIDDIVDGVFESKVDTNAYLAEIDRTGEAAGQTVGTLPAVEIELQTEDEAPLKAEKETSEKQSGFWNTWAGDFVERTGGQALNLLGGGFGFLDKMVQDVENLGLGTRGGMFKGSADLLKGYGNTLMEGGDRYKGKDFTDLYGEGDTSGAVGNLLLEGGSMVLPQIAAAMATGGTSAAGLMGASVYSDKFDQLNEENADMPEVAKRLNALSTASIELLSEKLSLSPATRWLKGLYKSKGKDAAKQEVTSAIEKTLASIYKKGGLLFEPVWEGVTEAASQLGENITDKVTGADPEVELSEGVVESFGYGVAGGASVGAFALPGMANRQYNKIKSRKNLNVARDGYTKAFKGDEKMLGLLDELEAADADEKNMFLEAISGSKTFTDEQKTAISNLVGADMEYRSWRTPEARQEEKTERRELAVQTALAQYDNIVAPLIAENGMIQQVLLGDGTGVPVAIFSGDIAVTQSEDGKTVIDRENSSPALYYKDENGDTRIVTPKEVFGVSYIANAQEQRAQYEADLRSQIDFQEQMKRQQREAEEAQEIENEDTVSYIDPDTGKQVFGEVKDITPDGMTVMVELDGGKIANVPRDIVTKSTIQTRNPEEVSTETVSQAENVAETVVQPEEAAELVVQPEETNAEPEHDTTLAGQEESQTEQEAIQQENTNKIPVDKSGNPIYHKAEIGDTLDDLLDGQLTIEEVDQFLDANLKDVESRIKSSEKEAPVMGKNKAEYLAKKKAYEAERAAIQQEADYWNEVKKQLQDARVKPGEEAAINLMRNTVPQSGEELAAQMLANGSIKLLQDDYRRETGGHISESRSLFGLFAGKDKGGVLIERAGEILMQADLENGTNFFDQKDPNAGRNAIIEVLSTARTRGDLINYIKNRREAKAEEIRQAEYNEYARWCEENYHLSPEDYEAYEDAVVRDFKEKMLTDEEQFELDSQMADEIRAIQEELEEIDAILAQNRTEKDENTEGNDESGGDVLREGGSEILQGEQSAQTGRSGEIEAGEPAGPGVDRANGVAQESAPGEIKPIGKGVFGDIYDQFRGKAKEAIKFLLRKRSGEAIGALHHKEVGDIDLVWGKEGTGKSNGFGLSKLAKFHPEVLDSLQDILDDMVVISRSANRVNLESKTHKAAVRLEWDGEKKNWLLTAFEKEKPTATDRTTDIGDTELQNDTAPLQTESSSTDKDSDSSRNINDLSEKIADAEANTDINPTEAQKEAGNYKKGHVRVGTFDISIEQPKGSVRSGVDANGKKWETTMQNTYGYIRGTEGVDGDHIDVFLSDDIDGWNGRKAFVVDQYNEDGSFDEHKVMLGFNEAADAETAYFANYDKDWAKKHKTVVTPVNLEDFEKWIGSSHRKTKAFAEYKSVKTEDVPQKAESSVSGNGCTIEPAQYTTKRGKVLDMQIVKFGRELSKDEFRSANAFAKSLKGWYDAKQRGFLMRSEDDAKQLVNAVIPKENAVLSVTQPEDSEHAVENSPQADEDIFQMAERIAKENARKAEEAGKEPVSLEQWKQMDGDARMAEVGKRPLTREEIENSSTDEVLRANALDYLDGNQGMIQSISYLKVYEDVRYSNRTAAADSGATDSAQLDTSATGNEQRVDVRDRGQSGKPDARLDRNAGEERISAEDRPLHADTSDARGDASGNGNGSSEPFFVRESVLQPGDAGGDVHRGSGVRSREGRDVGGGTGRKGHTASRKDSERGVQAGTAGNAKDDRGLSLNDPIEKELADALKEFDSVLDEFKRAGKEELSMSLAGLNSRQLEVLPRLVSAGAKVGYAYIKKGAHNFAEWAKRMREVFGGKLKEAGLGDNEIDAFIKEMWKSKLPMDGETHTVEEWASIIGKAELRKKIGGTLEEKRKAQQAAEPIPVKTCDRENIAETLPFLLPQQQDDVLKAETQFFDDSHSDRDHAFGKGYMFTNGTGTGKTYTGLGIVKRFIKQGKGRILVLTPSQKKVTDWIEDATNLGIELTTLDKIAKDNGTTAVTEKGEGAVITTYANFRQNKALLEDLFDLIVYDESHRLLENKGGIGTTGANQHYKLSNRNEQYAFLRLQEVNPIWNKMKKKESEFHKKRDSIIDRLKKESGITNELTFEQRGQFPPVLYGNWTADSERKFPELNKLRKEIDDLFSKYDKEIKPELERQAKENVKHTKVVFLSATPFNTRENLDYAEGYIFSYPENDKQAGYSVQSPRSQFYLEHFGSGYKWRYNRLESSMVNPDAVSKQEVEFSNYLQNTLQTMSGRIIDSPFDYSRDFPTVTMEKADEFNNAMEELSRNEATRSGYYKMMGDYNYSGALFESMKVTQIIPRLKEHLSRGRKVVIFHRRVESKNPLIPPFKSIFDLSIKALEEEYDATKKAENKKEIARLRRKYAGMLEWEQTLDLRMPREQLADAFGKDNVLFFSGKESEKVKNKAVKDFNNDQSGKDIIVIQENSGKEGISLHDTTGNHQRVLVTLALPQNPITALQIEGRIYRIGNKSNAIFEYPLLGLNAELMLFGQKFNQQVSTTENLALGSQARNLRESFARGVEEHSGDVDIDNQGVGGKEFDAPNPIETDAFDGAVLDYYTNQKLNGKRDSREGMDYYPTPEPLGFMMNQWARIGEGESVLEPSAGHGAIARYVPRENPLTAVEPSQSLFGKLQIKAGGNGRKFENTIFENYNVVNKHDVVLMNPPFGTGGRLAVDHVAKAFQHLEEGGRIVAIIPRGSTDKKFDKWYEGQKDAVLTAEIGLPDITFERAGTSVNCRVVVIDKVTNGDLRKKAASYANHIDLDGHYDKIEDFFEELRDVEVPERTIDQKAKLKKKAAPVARELRTVKGVRDVYLNENSISVSGRSVWDKIEWNDKKGNELTVYLSERYRRFKLNYDNAAKNENETSEAVYGELKYLACKLAGMTEDEMQRYIDKNTAENVRFRESSTVNTDIEKANERFNYELQRQIDGSLPKGHVYKLGNPSRFLQAAGFPDLPIELRADKLATKASEKYKSNHPFNLTSVENLPQAIANPIAVFDSKTRIDAKVVLTELESNGDNFVVAIQVNRKVGNIEINSVRSIYPKDYVKDIYSWINDGLLKWVDKKKATDFISNSSTPANVDDKNSSFSSATKIVESFVNPTLDEGKISSAVDELAGNLNTPIHIIRDINDITDEDKDTQRKKRGSKGWYDTKTGEVYLVLPNAESIADVQATILHEVVAHKGLRGLLGDHFAPTMDAVFDSLPQETQEEWMGKYDNRQVAAEEYCAHMAETMSDPGIIQKICSAIKSALRKIGIDLRMTDGDIMCMLWKSKNRLKESDTAFDVMRKARREEVVRRQASEYDTLFRSKKPIDALRISDEKKEKLKAQIQSRMELFQEAYVDRMIAVRKLQEEIARGMGKPLPDYMDVYTFENTLPGRNQYEQSMFIDKYLDPLKAAIRDLVEKGYTEREIENYVLAKHGIERNEYMRYAELESYIEAIEDEDLRNRLLQEIENKTFSQLQPLSEAKAEERRLSLQDKDFSGLTGVYADMIGEKDFGKFKKQMKEDKKTLTDFMPEISQMVLDMETAHKRLTDELWDKISAVNDFSLKKWFDSGMIDRKTYNNIKGMYSNYVPLRGFDEAQMHDVFDYVNEKDGEYSNLLKKARGRTSRPDMAFAHMASMGNSAIISGNKNQMKLYLYRMAMAGVTDRLSVRWQWYEKSIDADGNELWTPAYPEYSEDADQYRKNIEDFEADMLLKKSQGNATQKRGKLVNELNESERAIRDQHVVKVRVNGKEQVIYVNGNPKVAQAINGLNNIDVTAGKIYKVAAWWNRQMAANFTTRNPSFVLSNLSRDLIWSSTTLAVKEGGKYDRHFMRNIPKAARTLKKRLKAGKDWKPDPNDPLEVMLEEFLKNGAKTGYTALYNIDEYKRQIEDAMKSGVKAKARNKLGEVAGKLQLFNEWAEDLSRFAVYVTSREEGRSILRSVSDAKEVTVNFNRHGSGAKGNAFFRGLYIFFNAAIQSLNAAVRMGIKNPKGVIKLAGGTMLSGAVMPLLLHFLGDDGDMEEYMGLPDYVRKNNICIPLGWLGLKGFIKIPLPIELRALYGIGDSLARWVFGYDTFGEAAASAGWGLMDLLPLNPVGGTSSYVPSFASPLVESYVTNKMFSGKPIAKITPFNEYDPEYQKVYRGTSVLPVKLSQWLNMIAGGDESRREFETFELPSGVDLLNPASVEHLFEAYLGGAFTFVNQSFKTVGAIVGTNEFDARNLPIANRFYDTGDVDGAMMKVNEKYFDYVDEAKKAKHDMDKYERLINESPSIESAGYMLKRDAFERSDEWRRAEFILECQEEIKELMEEEKESTASEEKDRLQEEIAAKKKEMVRVLRWGKVPA